MNPTIIDHRQMGAQHVEQTAAAFPNTEEEEGWAGPVAIDLEGDSAPICQRNNDFGHPHSSVAVEILSATLVTYQSGRVFSRAMEWHVSGEARKIPIFLSEKRSRSRNYAEKHAPHRPA